MRYLLLLLVVFLVGCKTASAPDKITIRGEAFGTTYRVTYFGQGDDAKSVQKRIDSIVNVVNISMSTYLPESDISKINNGDSTIVIDDMFLDVFMLSRKLHKASNGYFDPKVGTLRNAYGFGDTEALNEIDNATLDSLMQYVGWDLSLIHI